MRKTILVLAGLLVLAIPIGTAMARPLYPACSDRTMRSCVESGNTFRYGGEFIRLENVNAPEPEAAACTVEDSTRAAATARLIELLNSGEFFVFRKGPDGSGRTLARVLVGGREIGETLLAEELARPNDSKTGAWCK